MAHTISVHPGSVLADELVERCITQSALASHIGVLSKTINEICRGKRGISGGDGRQVFDGIGRQPAVLAESSEELGTRPGHRAAFKRIKPMAA